MRRRPWKTIASVQAGLTSKSRESLFGPPGLACTRAASNVGREEASESFRSETSLVTSTRYLQSRACDVSGVSRPPVLVVGVASYGAELMNQEY